MESITHSSSSTSTSISGYSGPEIHMTGYSNAKVTRRQMSVPSKLKVRSTERHSRSPSPSRHGSPRYRYNALLRPRPKSADTLHRKPSVRSQSQYNNRRSKTRPFSAEMTKKNVWNRWYNKDRPKKLREGEVFSPILWRKFHIDEHLFDIPTENEISNQEMKDNLNKMKLKYPHLTKQYGGSNSMTAHREKILSEGYHRTSRFEASEDNGKQKHLWQRHVDMMKVSKSTSYFNFLSHFDRQSCRACSHSKTCSSKHCPSCGCGTKCEKHSINIDFLRYIPDKTEPKEPQPKREPERKVSTANNSTNKNASKKLSQQNLNVADISKRGYTMQGFTIMRKTPEMARKTLLSQHIEGKQCGGKSVSSKKCLACAFAKENVLMQKIKSSDFYTPPHKTGRRLSKNYTHSMQPNILY